MPLLLTTGVRERKGTKGNGRERQGTATTTAPMATDQCRGGFQTLPPVDSFWRVDAGVVDGRD
ncbi:MAG: hypothetical protein LBB93_05135 [Elusimicrobiota bacterium]|nr:hypothetical protein [Elusimicrobiota bacterium]